MSDCEGINPGLSDISCVAVWMDLDGDTEYQCRSHTYLAGLDGWVAEADVF